MAYGHGFRPRCTPPPGEDHLVLGDESLVEVLKVGADVDGRAAQPASTSKTCARHGGTSRYSPFEHSSEPSRS